MKQWMIDRYNKGQDKYIFGVTDDGRYSYIEKSKPSASCLSISLYDFLFNLKWEFAKAFFGEEEDFYSYDGVHATGENLKKWQWGLRCILTEIINGRDPLVMLESFREKH